MNFFSRFVLLFKGVYFFVVVIVVYVSMMIREMRNRSQYTWVFIKMWHWFQILRV